MSIFFSSAGRLARAPLKIPGLCLLAVVFFCWVQPGAAFAAGESRAAARALGPARPAITVTAPALVSDGEPFIYALEAPGLEKVELLFLGKTIVLEARPANPVDPVGTVGTVDPAGTAGTVGTGGTGLSPARRAEILLAIPLEHKKNQENVRWVAHSSHGGAQKGTSSIRVLRKKYPVQRLTLESKYVEPDPADAERIARERVLLRAALTTLSPEAHWHLPLKRPVPGIITSEYGLRRVLNGQPRSPHTGIDFRAAAGSPVAAIAPGIVVLTGDFYYPGTFVVLDHGLGTVSIYMHLSERIARQGQRLERGETVGLVGSTGRSTGPHLHLGFSVLGSSVSPLPLME